MAITAFTKSDVIAIRKEIDAEIQKVLKKYGLKVKPTTGRFSNTEFSWKMVLKIDSPEAVESEWNRYAFLFGLKNEDFGKTIVLGGRPFKLVDIKRQSRKYPIIGEFGGKRYRLTASQVKAALAMKAA